MHITIFGYIYSWFFSQFFSLGVAALPLVVLVQSLDPLQLCSHCCFSEHCECPLFSSHLGYGKESRMLSSTDLKMEVASVTEVRFGVNAQITLYFTFKDVHQVISH